MKVKRILITSDDGYDSLGVRLLVAEFKDKYKLTISGTKEQMSGVGGKITMDGGKWGLSEVDGVKALWVDGTPVDAVDCAFSHYGKIFDLVISGINWGANIGGSFISSGTIAAAWRALVLNFTKHSIAISWSSNPDAWFEKHDGNSRIPMSYLRYPGRVAGEVIRKAIEKQFWGASLLNINLPRKESKKIKFVEPLNDLSKYFKYPLNMDEKKGRYTYPPKYSDEMETDLVYDSAALMAGYITITPCRRNLMDEGVMERLRESKIEL